MRFALSVLIGTSALIAADAAHSQQPPGSQQVHECDARFVIPATLKPRNVKGIDSCVAEYRSDAMRVLVDAGLHRVEDPPAGTAVGFREEATTVDGKAARFTSYTDSRTSDFKFVAAVRVVVFEAKDAKQGSQFFTMHVIAKSASGLEAARQIFRSIRFDRLPTQ